MAYSNTDKHTAQHRGLLYVRFCLLLLLSLLFAFTHAGTSRAATDSISIIYSGEKSYTRKVIKELYRQLDTLPLTINTINLKHESLSRSPIGTSSLIISLGTQATRETLKLHSNIPLLSLLIPSQSYGGLQQFHNKQTPWKVLYIDLPFDRQIHFIQALLGKNKTIGTILGPYSRKQQKQLEKAANRTAQTIKIETIDNEKQLIPGLKSLVQVSDTLLAIPDPITFNKRTIRSILLLSYHQDIPLIGFSRSYVTAGALGAIFTEPNQISRQAADIIKQFFATRHFTSETVYCEQYSIAINKNVARALNLYLPGKDEIYKKMALAEE